MWVVYVEFLERVPSDWKLIDVSVKKTVNSEK